MPVKNQAAYGPGWKEFSRRIRFERDGGRCACTGQCRLSFAVGVHDGEEERCHATHGSSTASGGRVVLTVAHLCHDASCRDETHVKAMCQRCHLAYDRELHSRNASATARRKRLARAPMLPGLADAGTEALPSLALAPGGADGDRQ